MFYQVLVETSEKGKNGEKNMQHFELDKTDINEIENDLILPYLQENQIQFDGYFIQKKDIKRIIVKQTNETTETLSKFENDHMPSGVIMFISRSDILSYDKYTTDITKKLFTSAQAKLDSGPKTTKPLSKPQRPFDNSKVFVVHGHDELAKAETARFIEQLGFEPIILHEQASCGKTIIEKIEAYSDVGFGVILYTPCDVGAKSTPKPTLLARARQNVVFEHGFLLSKLGRHNVCALVKNVVETPNDISGVVYVKMDDHGSWKLALAKELRNAGYNVDMNKVI